jgi:hypothetical protein
MLYPMRHAPKPGLTSKAPALQDSELRPSALDEL